MQLKGYTEEEIAKIMAYYARERETELWGDKMMMKPEIISETQGDALQAVYLCPLDTRPNYYVLRIDSSIDIENVEYVNEGTKDEINISEMLLQMVESEHDSIESYEEIEVNGETMYQYNEDEEPKTWAEVDFPTLHWSGGSWGAMCDVSHILNVETINEITE